MYTSAELMSDFDLMHARYTSTTDPTNLRILRARLQDLAHLARTLDEAPQDILWASK